MTLYNLYCSESSKSHSGKKNMKKRKMEKWKNGKIKKNCKIVAIRICQINPSTQGYKLR